MKQLFVHKTQHLTQLAMVEEGRLVELNIEHSANDSLIGNLYKGRVVNVLPGMQAAFIDIGLNKNAFLYVDDVLHHHLDKQPKDKPSIDELLSVGDELVVQVVKEPLGGKGARLTTHYSLPGRFLVYMPEADYVGISKKIEQESERNRLRQLAEQIRGSGEGIIMRTNAEGEDLETLAADLAALRQRWQLAMEISRQVSAPAELHRDFGLVQRMVRDLVTPDVEELIFDDRDCMAEARTYLRLAVPELESKMRMYEDDTKALFDHFGITAQIRKAFHSHVRLPSGGDLVWDRTEAFTIVDVNTGKFTGTASLEETVFRTNLEAAEEIARLLRLRNVGGIIIVDFIDMNDEEHRAQVVEQLESTMKHDRTKCQIVGWTRLGLLEITRKKARASALEYYQQTCPVCKGQGAIAIWNQEQRLE